MKETGVIEAVGAKSSLAWISSADKLLGALDPAALGALVCVASDIALILDSHGAVVDHAISDPALAKMLSPDWIGRRWADTVTTESRIKIEEMLREATSTTPTRWRQVNYAAPGGPDIPVRYCALRFGPERRVLAVGRDLRAVAVAQQRLAEAQQAMEREYQRIRDAEKRYRLLFQLASEAVLIVDAGSHRVLEGNPAAAALLGLEAKKVAGQPFAELFNETSRPAAQSFIAAARVAPRVDNVMVEAAHDGAAVLLSGALFRQDTSTYVIVLIARMGRPASATDRIEAKRLKVVEALPLAFVVADADLRILSANAAFVDLVQSTTEAQVRGEPLERWLGRPGVDAGLLLTNLRGAGVVRRFATFVHGEFGSNEDVEISAVSELDGPDPCIGLTLSVVATRGGRERLGGRELPKTVEQFTDLVGRVPLKNLVRETTDLIERLCIEAALELTQDNRASAAEMLGLSRQGFYAKLRRYGLGDLEPEAND